MLNVHEHLDDNSTLIPATEIEKSKENLDQLCFERYLLKLKQMSQKELEREVDTGYFFEVVIKNSENSKRFYLEVIMPLESLSNAIY